MMIDGFSLVIGVACGVAIAAVVWLLWVLWRLEEDE